MTCGVCPFTDNLCYCSMPPQVKCTITNEFHYYSDECNCLEAMASRKAELDFVLEKLNETGPLMAINYDGPDAPSVSFSGEDVAKAYDNLLASNPADNNKISINPISSASLFSLADVDACLCEPFYAYATSCLVCGIDVPCNPGEGQKICPDCKRIVKFIKEKFKEELDKYEV
jgi:hypothetical protein